MSLLRVSSNALAKPFLLHSSLVARALSTEAAPPTPTAKEPSEIAPVPQKDVLSADAISGAPGTTFLPSERNRVLYYTQTFSRAPAPRCAYIPACPQHNAERWCERETLASRLGYPAWRWALGESVDGLGKLVCLLLRTLCVLSLTMMQGRLCPGKPALVSI